MKNEKLVCSYVMAAIVVVAVALLGYGLGWLGQQNTIFEKDKEISQVQQEVTIRDSKISGLDKAFQDKVAEVDALTVQNQELSSTVEELQSRRPVAMSRGDRFSGGNVFEATAYTDGGHTASGFNLTGHSWESAMVIATDPSVIPLGSQVYVEFDGDWAPYSGVYTASDTGGAINGNIIDVFVGHGEESLAMQFGRRNVRVYYL